MFHVKQPKWQTRRREMEHARWVRSLECQIGRKLPRRGPPRPDVVYRNRLRMIESWQRYDDWLDFKARSDARTKA